MTTWEERMADRHRPTYRTDPVPPRRPRLSDRFTMLGDWGVSRFVPWLLCRTCFEWVGSWKLTEAGEWEPHYYWRMHCDGKCGHFHHSREVLLA